VEAITGKSTRGDLRSQNIWWRKRDDPAKTIDRSQVTDKLYHIMLYRVVHLVLIEIQTQFESLDINKEDENLNFLFCQIL
jgi:hypothetical protein